MTTDSPTGDDPDPNPAHKATGFQWKQLFDPAPSRESPSSSPVYYEDGTPVVLAPSSVIFNASQAWTGHLICHFLGDPPSPTKIFSDLNPVWGRKGSITVRRFSEGTCLVHVPSASMRRWILDAGLWSSGTVSFTVSEWEASASLVSTPLTSAPTVLTIRGVPPQLWSQRGVETIAGGVASLIPNARASLPLSSLGTAKIRVIVPLGPSLPPSVIVKDSNGDTVRVTVEYGRLPTLCSTCQSFGHSAHRCPSRRSKVSKPSGSDASESITAPSSSDESLLKAPSVHNSQASVQGDEVDNLKNPNATIGLQRPTNLTQSNLSDQQTNSLGSDPSLFGPILSKCPSPPAIDLEPGEVGTVDSSAPPPDLPHGQISATTTFDHLPKPNSDHANSSSTDPPPVAYSPDSFTVTNHPPSPLPPKSPLNPSLQIKADIQSPLDTPRLNTSNTHIYFDSPSTSSSLPLNDTTTSVPFQEFYKEVLNSLPTANSHKGSSEDVKNPTSKTETQPITLPKDVPKQKKKDDNSKKKQSTFNFDDDGEAISRILNSKQWQNGYRSFSSDEKKGRTGST